LNSLGNTLNSGLDIIVSNALLGAVAMGQVSIVKTMNTVFSSIFQMTSQPFEPTFLRNYAENNKTELISSLKYSMKLSGMLSNVVFAGVASLGLCYYKLWIPNQNYVLLYRLTVIAVLSSLFEGAISPMYYIYTLTVKNKIPCIITILGGIFNVIGMYALIQNTNLGIYAIFLTTAVVMLLINGVSNPIYMCRCLKIPWYTFYPTLIRHVISCFIMTGLMMILTHILNPSTWIDFIACGVLYVILGMIVHIMVLFNLSELRKATKKFITIFVDKIHI
jgi:O-antigen/teichoic acid export membrane protein